MRGFPQAFPQVWKSPEETALVNAHSNMRAGTRDPGIMNLGTFLPRPRIQDTGSLFPVYNRLFDRPAFADSSGRLWRGLAGAQGAKAEEKYG